MSEKSSEPDIEPRRVNVADVPKTDLIGLSPKERALAEADVLMSGLLSTRATLLGRYGWRVAGTSSALRNLAGQARFL